MTSYTPNCQSLDYTHMYIFNDYRNLSNKHKVCTNPDSILGFIYNNPKFSKFFKITERAMMVGQLNNIQANFTIFIPSNDSLQHIPDEFLNTMDDGMAKQIVSASILDRKIDKLLLTRSPVSYFHTKNPEMRMYITNIRGKTEINGMANVIEWDIERSNGIIHIIDTLLVPNENTFEN